MDQLTNDLSGVLTIRQFDETETQLPSCQLNEKIIRAQLKLKRLARFLEPALPFLNCHFTDYFIKSYWTNLVPERLRIDLESKSLEEVKNCVRKLTRRNSDFKWESPGDFNFRNVPSLELLVSAIEKLNLRGEGQGQNGLCSSFQEVQEVRGELLLKHPEKFVDLEFDKFMSSKKMHEVLKFSEFIACVSTGIRSWGNVKGQGEDEDHPIAGQNQKEIRHLVDVGSGKGYLSSFLAMYYDLKVLAIDASAVNTEGCQKRSAKLDKTWPQLVRRAKERQRTGGSCTSFGKHRKKKLSSLGISEDEYKENLQKSSAGDIDKNLKSVTELITTKTDLQLLLDTNFSEDDHDGKINYGIAGLHTCGNLGANILKLFLNNEKAKFICVIPCCYNLVQEDETLFPCRNFHGSKLHNEDTKESPKVPWPDGSIGFPLSDALKNYGGSGGGETFFLGRNARMLSAYSLPRMICDDDNLEMPSVLYYRAILQLLLKRHGLLQNEDDVTGAISEPEARVGRMRKKCENFRDYVTFALEKLGIDDENAKSALMNDVEQVEAEYATPEVLEKFHKFYLLRAMFASVVENLILLDRVVYLLEQDCIAEARVVQLFDPAVSPRSHAIVAIKKEIRR